LRTEPLLGLSLSRVKRWFEGLSYLPGYYRIFFLYFAIILVVFLYTVFKVRPLTFVKVALVVGYSGIFFPIFTQNVVSKLSRSVGWWFATALTLAGFYALLRILVSLQLLDTGWRSVSGYIYTMNLYGIIWAGMIAIGAVANLVANHGFSGLTENIRRDLGEIRSIRRMTRGEPLILDKRTLAFVAIGLIFTGGIFAFRMYYLKRPDVITAYQFPLKLFENSTTHFALALSNEINEPVEMVRVSFSGYYRYPARANYTGDDLMELAKSIPIIRAAFERAKEAPADMIVVDEKRMATTSAKELRIDFSRAFDHLGLYPNATSHLLIPSKFIISWDTKEKRIQGVWVGTPGLPFMRFENGTFVDGRGEVSSSTPYTDLIRSGIVEFKDLGPGTKYGFNLTAVYEPWLGEDFKDIDQFVITGDVEVSGKGSRRLADVMIKKATETAA